MVKRSWIGALLVLWITLLGSAAAATLRVGPQEAIRTVAAASVRARDGDTVEIIAGTYRGDVAVWSQKRLTIRGIGGRPQMLAAGRSAEDKAIWVVRGEDIVIENVAFRGARVLHRNGAGIRLEEGRLTVRDCLFEDNEMGILTANRESISLVVENSEFAHGVLLTPRLSHLLYAGRIARLEVRGSYFHHGRIGHLLKSRARFNLVEYSRLTDEAGGEASYELDFPDGGVVILVGNLIRQSPTTQNGRIVSFGAEGLQHPDNALVLASNTLVDDLPLGGEFVHVWSPEKVSVKAFNNLLIGNCDGLASCVEVLLKRSAQRLQDGQLPWTAELFTEEAGNVHVAERSLRESLVAKDFRPPASMPWAVKLVAPGSAFGVALLPTREYAHRAGSVALRAAPRAPGAFQP